MNPVEGGSRGARVHAASVRRDLSGDALPRLAEFVLGLADLGMAGERSTADPYPGLIAPMAPLVAESISVQLPVEIEVVRADDGTLVIGCSPPTSYTETSLMPSFHSIRVRLAQAAGD